MWDEHISSLSFVNPSSVGKFQHKCLVQTEENGKYHIQIGSQAHGENEYRKFCSNGEG